MAFDSNGIKFLLYAKRMGADFRTTATVGRQFNFVDASVIHDLFVRAGQPAVDPKKVDELLAQYGGFSEGIFELLGAETADSFDASRFEGSSHIHDFNDPIGEEFKNRYSTVIDCGTLEHVFNYPTALRNCMEMVNLGGTFLAITPVNNFPGHGFYQFSPEVFFRSFSDENGFDVIDAIFMEDRPDAPWYRIKDPAKLGRRVTFENTRPAYLLLIARRIKLGPVFARFPQQSDYSTAWEAGSIAGQSGVLGLSKRIPRAIKRRANAFFRPRALRSEPGDLEQFDPLA